MRLENIVAQDIAVRALKTSILRGQVAHAHLFCGPTGCGKASTALAFASALNCTDPGPDGDACGICMSCIRIDSGTDPDVGVISPDGNQTKMEQMQDMIRDLNYAPLSGKYRIFIIEQADTLNAASENSILKILEEPPPYAALILLSANPNSLLATIRSRCRMVRFRRARTDEVGDALCAKFTLPKEEAAAITACSTGLIGKAFTMATGADALEDRRLALAWLNDFLNSPSVAAVRTAGDMVEKCTPKKKNDPDERTRVRRLTDMLENMLSWYADLLSLLVRGDGAVVANVDQIDALRTHAPRFSTARLSDCVKTIMNTRRYLEGNATPQLALECMLLSLRPDQG